MIIYSKQKNDEKILEKATKILELTQDLDPDDPLIKQKQKPFFFRAQVHRRNTDFERCEVDLDEASKICNDAKLKKSIESEYELLKKSKLVEEKKYERRMQRAMKRAKKMKKAEVKSAKKVDELDVAESSDVKESIEEVVEAKVENDGVEKEDVEEVVNQEVGKPETS